MIHLSVCDETAASRKTSATSVPKTNGTTKNLSPGAQLSDSQIPQIDSDRSSSLSSDSVFTGCILAPFRGVELRHAMVFEGVHLVYDAPALPSPTTDSVAKGRLNFRSCFMLTKISLLLSVVCIMVLIGCAKTGNTNGNTGTTANTNKATNTAAAQKIGVPECDEFIAAYDACVSSKVPESARAQYKTAIEQWRTSWSKLAANPNTKATLAAACKQSAESARASMKSYGCTF